MGRLFDELGGLTFRNEAEVGQNFILPLLQRFLGYELSEIVPEHNFPARLLDWGVKSIPGGSKRLNHRPDFVVCINGNLDDARFIVDSKGPAEDIDSHFGQLRSYAISVGRNLLMMTNGIELKVYDVNHLLFHSKSIVDLQLMIGSLTQLLGRESQVTKSPAEIIQEFDYKEAISATDQAVLDEKLRQKQLLLVDFRDYLRNVLIGFEQWHLPTKHFEALSNLVLRQFDPNQLLSLRKQTGTADPFGREKLIKLPDIEADRSFNCKVFVGETGCGKSCLLKYLTYRAAQEAWQYREARIPVFVSLRDIGQGYTLENLIVFALNRYGYRCSTFHEVPKSNDFVFFLDAYDEIRPQFLQDAVAAIDRLGDTYECYLTTRPSRPTHVASAVVYQVLPISEAQVEALVRRYIDSQHYEFKRQLEKNNLTVEAGNILLLLCLISLFKESNTLPGTVTKVIHGVVDRVRKWQDSKHLQGGPLSWKATEAILAVLGYKGINGGAVALSRGEAEILVHKGMMELEKARKMPGGVTVDDVLNSLAETGLLMVTDDQVYFWHRLFMNYFAAKGLQEVYREDREIIEKLALEAKWRVIIVGVAALLPSVADLVRSIQDNLWLSAACLVENAKGDTAAIQFVVDGLIAQLRSEVPMIRQRAVNFLSAIELDQARQFLLKAAEGDYSADVRMLALMAIGRFRSAEARVILYRHLSWAESDFMLGLSSQACVVRALYYYNEDEHLEIIKLWEKTPDFRVAEECKAIFIELHSQKRLTEKLVKELKLFFLRELNEGPKGREQLNALAAILSLVPDDTFAAEVLELAVSNDDIPQADAVYELLKNYQSPGVIADIKQKIWNSAEHNYVSEQLMEIIVDSAADVPRDTFYELSEHGNPNIAAKAVGGLKRFPYESVKEQVERHLFGDQPQLQSWALGVLVDNGEVVSLIRSGRFPNPFFTPAAHALLRAIRLFRLGEGLPLMERIFKALGEQKRYEFEVHLALNLAGTYYFMGESDRQAAIIGWFFDGQNFLTKEFHIHVNLMRELKHFDPELAILIAAGYFRMYFPFKGEESSYKVEVFLECVEELGQHRLVPFVKEIVQSILDDIKIGNTAGSFYLERPMRALVNLAESSDEEWILSRLDELRVTDRFEFPELRRAAECLAYIGSARALPYLRQIAVQRKGNPMVLNVCQVAYEQICQREKIPFYSGDLLREPMVKA